jgi:hypothetical protein
MSEVVRLYQYKSLLVGRRALSAEDLMARLEISRATLKRDIAKLREVPLRCTALVAHQPVGVCKRRSEWDRLGATTTPTLLPAARNKRIEATIWRRDQRRDPRWPLNLCRTDHKVRRTDLIELKLLRCRRLNAILDQRAATRFSPNVNQISSRLDGAELSRGECEQCNATLASSVTNQLRVGEPCTAGIHWQEADRTPRCGMSLRKGAGAAVLSCAGQEWLLRASLAVQRQCEPL